MFEVLGNQNICATLLLSLEHQSTFPKQHYVNTSGNTTKTPTGTSQWDPARPWQAPTALCSVPPQLRAQPTLQTLRGQLRPQNRALASTRVVESSLYLLLHFRVFFDSFHSNNVGFQLGGHANQPVQVCCDLQGESSQRAGYTEQATCNK